jgi:hypothetical protein
MSQADEILKRFGAEPESFEKLAADATRAESGIGIHGVSVTARKTSAPAGRARRGDVEVIFRVHNTGNDPKHRTVE